MRSAIGVRVAAPPATVFELVREVERWSTLLPHYRQSRVEARSGGRSLMRMTAVRQVGQFGVPVSWRAVYWSESDDAFDLRLRFRHVRGATRGMDVTWHIRPVDEGAACDVTIEHDFRRPIRGLGGILSADAFPAVVDRLFTQPIAGRTLATFRDLAERGTELHGAAQSPAGRPTNQTA